MPLMVLPGLGSEMKCHFFKEITDYLKVLDLQWLWVRPWVVELVKKKNVENTVENKKNLQPAKCCLSLRLSCQRDFCKTSRQRSVLMWLLHRLLEVNLTTRAACSLKASYSHCSRQRDLIILSLYQRRRPSSDLDIFKIMLITLDTLWKLWANNSNQVLIVGSRLYLVLIWLIWSFLEGYHSHQGSLPYFPLKITGQSYSYDAVQIGLLASYVPLWSEYSLKIVETSTCEGGLSHSGLVLKVEVS